MGMLIDGQWSTQDNIIKDGVYQRAASPLRVDNIEEVAQKISERPKNYWLIGSKSCPWCHRILLMRALKRLPLLVHHAFGERVEGYALNGGKQWIVPGSLVSARHMHEVYTLHDPNYTGRVTVPVLWDIDCQRIISNESADILAILDAVKCNKEFDFTLRPVAYLDKIESANVKVYNGLNNAVYQAGFAESQSAYDDAISTVFETLDDLERRLAGSRYYFGSVVTETDLRLFPTLVRFDAIYAILFKCSLRRLTDYPNLWAYARDLFALNGAGEAVDFDQMRQASYLADARQTHPIIAVAPDVDWRAPHARSELGPTKLTMRSGETRVVCPTTFAPLAND
ncbi:MAG: glutathione S-transferase C-terminal domain-containing protein [Parasphingorhabdus sp.]